MKAIVLSHDRNRLMVEHMIATFKRHWPNHPFTFRVPYQIDSVFHTDPDRLEAVKTSAPIKSCVLELLDDLPDEEWVYWCIDDKFLIHVDETIASHLVRYVSSLRDSTVQGLLFCRCRRMWDPASVGRETVAVTGWGVNLKKRYDFNQIWLHQFLRVGVLRQLFSDFPNRPFEAIEMDAFTEQGEHAKRVPASIMLLVTENNYMVLGESTRGGRLTQTCVDSLGRYGMRIPEEFEILRDEVTMGGCEHAQIEDRICPACAKLWDIESSGSLELPNTQQ